MPQPTRSVIDANEAVARVAHLYSEVIPIYPITPASPMAEHADAWSAKQRRNLWGTVPEVTSLQSEAGAAGALHGAVTRGALGTTFTASQGLLLMIPNMYKIAGELTPTVIHVAARTLATHALSIFGDHSDVMSARQTGFAMLCASSVQEAGDFAAVAHVATLASRVPFMHFFDGFRTSHELATIDLIDEQTLRDLIDPRDLAAHRLRGLDPDRPVLRGTAQNPDVFFQAREAANPFHEAVPGIVAETFDRIAEATGRRYGLVDYVGHPEADRVIVLMGSGAGAVGEAVKTLANRGEKVGLLVVRLYRPFPVAELIAALPPTVRTLAVLDRTKEPGAPADPLHLDVMAALYDPLAAARFTAGAAPDDRRALRAVEQGVHPGDGRRGLHRGGPEGAPAPVRGRHRRRRDEQLPRGPHGLPGRHLPCSGGLLRPRLGRHGRRQQEHRHHRRRCHGPQRAGVLRLRLEEVRLGHREPPALRRGADHQHLPDQRGHVRRRPPVGADGEAQRPGCGRPRRPRAAQLAASCRRGLGPPAQRGPAAGAGQGPRPVDHRRHRRGPQGRHRRAHQHRHAGVLLRDLRGAAPRGGACRG